MKAIKGCINTKCEYNVKVKNKHYKEFENFCSVCGEHLQYVCIRCHTVVSGPNVRYCEVCQKDVDEHKAKVIADAKKVIKVSADTAVKVVTDPTVREIAKIGVEVAAPYVPVVGPLAVSAISKADTVAKKIDKVVKKQ